MRMRTTSASLTAAIIGSALLASCAMAETPTNNTDGNFVPPFMSGHGPGMMGMGGMGMGGPMGFSDPATTIKTLKSDLAITKDEEPAWNAYAKVLEEHIGSAQATRQGVDHQTVYRMAPEERAKFMTQMMSTRQQQFEALKTAAEQLLPSLTDFQKGKASAILPGLASPGMMHSAMGGPMR